MAVIFRGRVYRQKLRKAQSVAEDFSIPDL